MCSQPTQQKSMCVSVCLGRGMLLWVAASGCFHLTKITQDPPRLGIQTQKYFDSSLFWDILYFTKMIKRIVEWD